MNTAPLAPGLALPLTITPAAPAKAGVGALDRWLLANRERLDDLLQRHGALLLRGFALHDDAAFAHLAGSLLGELRAYLGGDSPRQRVLGNVYTASEYGAELEVRLHNELSYGAWWPQRVLFYCDTPAASGGQTQIADGRRILAELPAAVREPFAARGVRYLQYLPDAAVADGRKSWQQTFDTGSREAVERHCREAGMEWNWGEQGIETAVTRPGVLGIRAAAKPPGSTRPTSGMPASAA